MATWIEAHGGTADSGRAPQTATHGSAPEPVSRCVGVAPPRLGAPGGSTAAIKADFQRAIGRDQDVAHRPSPTWLPADPGMSRDLSAATFPYSSAAIPYRDFPFGTCPRLGRGGTSSNRSDNATRSIRLFSAARQVQRCGRAPQRPCERPAGTDAGYVTTIRGICRMSRRARVRARSTPGPPANLARLLLGGEPGFDWPDFAAPRGHIPPVIRDRSDLSRPVQPS